MTAFTVIDVRMYSKVVMQQKRNAVKEDGSCDSKLFWDLCVKKSVGDQAVIIKS